MASTGLSRARRSQAALALDPIPASKLQSVPLEFAELPRKAPSKALSMCRGRGECDVISQPF
jgi:hypothetical protein